MMRRAFPRTVPVLAGYLFLGIAYGISMKENGFGVGWALLISAVVYGGSMQFALISQLSQPFSPLTVALMTLLIHARHIFYGLSMLDKYEGTGRWKPYLIFALSDETYSLVVEGAPEDLREEERGAWYAAVSALDRAYWLTGTVMGGLLGALLPLSLLTGIDFAMTALFTVILTEQSMDAVKAVREGRMTRFDALFPPLLGALATLVSLLLVGTGRFLLLSMGLMLCMFLLRYVTQPAGERGRSA